MSLYREWFRNYSKQLQTSFEASGLIAHGVTKGETREDQITDLLLRFLPNRYALTRPIVIADNESTQACSFDGAWLDVQNFPRLFASDTVMAMVESVICVLEVKSDLSTQEIGDLFRKAKSLDALKRVPSVPAPIRSVAAFGYRSTSKPGILFYDYALNAITRGSQSTEALCILNSSVMTRGQLHEGNVVVGGYDNKGDMPLLFQSAEDSLLLFMLILTSWVSSISSIRPLIAEYGKEFFYGGTSPLYFDSDFLQAISEDGATAAMARQHFLNVEFDQIEKAYRKAREGIGLKDSLS